MAEKAEEKKKRLSISELFKALRIYRFILPYKWHFIIGMICLVISTGVVSVIPGGFGDLINTAVPAKDAVEKITTELKSDHSSEAKLTVISQAISKINDGKNPERMKQIGIILGLVLLVQSILSFFRIYLFEYVSQKSMAAIRSALYERIITLPIQFLKKIVSATLHRVYHLTCLSFKMH